mgnify:FL=1|jgi:hypothetical protein|tara:strand:+ start:582 stop:797 length:216 start_codon:yes stop_codon:yes gene_type:complete
MTDRDRFAGLAMNALIQTHGMLYMVEVGAKDFGEKIAFEAYAMANLMMEAGVDKQRVQSPEPWTPPVDDNE